MVAADAELRRLDPYKRLSAETGPHVAGAALPTDRIQSVDVYYSEETPVIFWTNDERHTVSRYTPAPHARAKRQTTETVVSGAADRWRAGAHWWLSLWRNQPASLQMKAFCDACHVVLRKIDVLNRTLRHSDLD